MQQKPYKLHHVFYYHKVYSYYVYMFLFTSETKEAAFVYALASATVVHAVADKCAKKKCGLPYCKCNMDSDALETGESWEGCLPDIKFGMDFAKLLLNTRDDFHATSNHKDFILHNSEIGRLVSSLYIH